MVDPRFVEIAFLSALDQGTPTGVTVSEWSKRLGVSEVFLRDMIFGLFRDGCLEGTNHIMPPTSYGNIPGGPAEPSHHWGQRDVDNSVKTLLGGGNSFAAYVNHAGRLRLWRMRDEIFKARIKDSFDLLWDKRHWNADLAVRLAMKTPDESAAVMFIDVDDFKSVNEKAGHTVGDEILRIVFQVVLDLAAVGGGDAYRWGGDEVTVFLEGLQVDACKSIGDAIRIEVERQCALHPALMKAGLRTTVSIGVGGFTDRPSPVDLTARVAELMKTVKVAGKNSVVAETLKFSEPK